MCSYLLFVKTIFLGTVAMADNTSDQYIRGDIFDYYPTAYIQSDCVYKTMNQQQDNHCLRIDSSLSHQGGGGGGLKCILLVQ